MIQFQKHTTGKVSINVARIHCLVGSLLPTIPQKLKNVVLVTMPHELKSNTGIGCGAPGHFNNENQSTLIHSVNELFEKLNHKGINPAEYFGLDRQQLISQVNDFNLESNAYTRAKNFILNATNQNVPLIVGIHSSPRRKSFRNRFGQFI